MYYCHIFRNAQRKIYRFVPENQIYLQRKSTHIGWWGIIWWNMNNRGKVGLNMEKV